MRSEKGDLGIVMFRLFAHLVIRSFNSQGRAHGGFEARVSSQEHRLQFSIFLRSCQRGFPRGSEPVKAQYHGCIAIYEPFR